MSTPTVSQTSEIAAARSVTGIIDTLTRKERSSQEKYAEMEVRSMTGAGAEKAVVH